MHDEMKMAVQCLDDLKKTLTDAAKSYLGQGLEHVDGKELGEVVDMIKDLADAKEKCYEACYYETVIKAMEEESEEEERYGYNNRRMANGRYASKGHGHIMGYRKQPYPKMYKPYVDQEPYIKEYLDDPEHFEENMRMGYDPNWREMPPYPPIYMGYDGNRSGNMSGNGMNNGNSRYGQAYNQYQSAKRHYTATGSHDDEQEMKMHAQEHFNDMIATMRDIWGNVDPAMKKKMKADLQTFAGELTI